MRIGLLSALLLAPVVASAQQLVLHHQGRLLDAQEQGVTGTQAIRIALYDDKEAATALWSETYEINLGPTGLYTIAIGDSYGTAGKKGLTEADFAGERWLGVTLDEQPEFRPRLPIGVVARSIVAARAETANVADALSTTATVAADRIVGRVKDSEMLGGKTPRRALRGVHTHEPPGVRHRVGQAGPRASSHRDR